MKQYVEGEVYIIYVRQFGLPASNSESYYVRARCVGGNDLNVGYFEDSKGYRFNSCIDRATLERGFVWDKEIVDIHPFPNPHVRKHSEVKS